MNEKKRIFELIPGGFFCVTTIEKLWYEEVKVLTINWVKKKKNTKNHELNRKGPGCLNALVKKKKKKKKTNPKHKW